MLFWGPHAASMALLTSSCHILCLQEAFSLPLDGELEIPAITVVFRAAHHFHAQGCHSTYLVIHINAFCTASLLKGEWISISAVLFLHFLSFSLFPAARVISALHFHTTLNRTSKKLNSHEGRSGSHSPRQSCCQYEW
jgi:hypothetical protein